MDEYEIARLVTRLGRWLDEPAASWNDDERYAGLGAIYTEDVELSTPRGSARGLGELVAYLRENSSDDERTQHLSSDVLVERDGDTAAVSANLVVHYYRPGQEPFRTAGLRWEFEAVRGPSGWRFARAEVAPLWFSPAA